MSTSTPNSENSRQKISQCADCIVLAGNGRDMQVLLIIRKFEPYKQKLAFPGGFLEKKENALECALRELKEETQLELNQNDAIALSARSRPGRDPRGATTSFPFLFYLEKCLPVRGGDDALEARWFKMTEISELAFDHGSILCEVLAKFWKIMPSYEPKLETISTPFETYENRDKVTFFGGSFNPWHQGHSSCVELFKEKENLVVVPDQNPQKELDPLGEGFCYFKLFLSICKQMSSYKVMVYPGFIGIEYKNPTASWLPRVKVKEKSLLLGADSFMNLDSWINSSVLLRSLHTLFVVPRYVEEEKIELQKNKILSSYPNIEINILPHHPFESLSSSLLRK